MNTFAALAPLFRYPDDGFRHHLDEAQRAAPPVASFANAIADVRLDSLQALYSSTFDLAPSCSPYLGSHVFGDETPERARLMLGLRMKGAGSTELPDHIAEVLARADAFDDDEWHELRELILVPALAKMDELLRATANPYRHLVAAVLTEGGAS
jgi:nitrate reductase assembly molybdenum cofactor insertion protein NarJ